jgi:uncharacterized protein DUF4189
MSGVSASVRSKWDHVPSWRLKAAPDLRSLARCFQDSRAEDLVPRKIISILPIFFLLLTPLSRAHEALAGQVVCGFNVKTGLQAKDWDLGNGIRTKAKSSLADANLIVEMMRAADWPQIQDPRRDGLGQPSLWLIRGVENAYVADELGWPTYPRSPAIFLDDDWARMLTNRTQSQWTRAAILAHELGHCRYRHEYEGSTGTIWQEEYAADRFAGAVLCKLGCPLEDAQSLYYEIAEEGPEDPSSHPSLSTRLQAVREGWLGAGCIENATPEPPSHSEWVTSTNCNLIRWVCTSKYGAISYSPSTRNHGYSYDYPDRFSAEKRAQYGCGQPDCQVVVWFCNACGALFVDDFGNWSAAWANDRETAEWKAKKLCGGVRR